MIRGVRREDLDAWVDLRAELWPHHERRALMNEAEEFLAKPGEWGLFVAEEDGRLVGLVECSIRSEAPGCTADRIGYLEGWYVRPDRRRTGVGRALVEAAAAWSLARGCGEMASDTSSRFPDGPGAHEAIGFVETKRRIFYRRDLPGA